MSDNDKVEDTTIDETIEEQGSEETPEVELDKATDIEGDLVENPTLEVEDEPGEDHEEADPAKSTDDDKAPEEVAEVATEPTKTVEKDETGVYAPATQADPGEFQPKGDYSFEITQADGKTVKINTPQEAEAFAQRLDTEEDLLTAYQFTQFQRNFLKMDSAIDREKIQYDTEKETFETQQSQQKIRNEQISQWSHEIDYLEKKGLIPEITQAQNTSNWTDPKNADVPAIKERLAIFKWMEGENNDRRTAGISEITSAVDAFRLMQADTSVQAAKTEKSREVTIRQNRGKMVSGTSSFIPENSQKDSVVGEGGSLKDLVAEFSASQ